MSDRLTRSEALSKLAIVPAVALGAAALSSPALAAPDNKKQFKYQDKPKDGKKCAGCSLFKAPNACSVVTGKISPNGYCIAYAPKAKK